MPVYDFNPRPPCGGRRDNVVWLVDLYQFQSPSSVWRTTEGHTLKTRLICNFNPRPPCGGRLARFSGLFLLLLFQSPSSVWRTTYAPA